MPTEVLQLRIPPWLKEQIKAKAYQIGMSQNQLAINILASSFENRGASEEETTHGQSHPE